MFYLAITAKRKDAKRHVCNKSDNIDDLRRYAINLSDKYNVAIYDGKWNLVETLTNKKEEQK